MAADSLPRHDAGRDGDPEGQEGDYNAQRFARRRGLRYIRQEKSVTPHDRPFFIYYAPGATHAPHHVPKAWIEKVQGPVQPGLGQVS